MSSLSNMYVEESPNKKTGDAIYIRKRKLYIILGIAVVGVLAALIFVYSSAKGSANNETAKKCVSTLSTAIYTTGSMPTALTTTPPFDLNKECSAAICANPYVALGNIRNEILNSKKILKGIQFNFK